MSGCLGPTPGPDRRLLSWAAAAERLRDICYVARDDHVLQQAADEANRALGGLGRQRPDIGCGLPWRRLRRGCVVRCGRGRQH